MMDNKLLLITMLLLFTPSNSSVIPKFKNEIPNLNPQIHSNLDKIFNVNTPNNDVQYESSNTIIKELEIFKELVEQALFNLTNNELQQSSTDDALIKINNDLDISDKNIKSDISAKSKHKSEQLKNKETKQIDSQKDELDGLIDTIKKKITNITKSSNKSSTYSPDKKKLNQIHCVHKGHLCEYCNSPKYLLNSDDKAKTWCLKNCKTCSCCYKKAKE